MRPPGPKAAPARLPPACLPTVIGAPKRACPGKAHSPCYPGEAHSAQGVSLGAWTILQNTRFHATSVFPSACHRAHQCSSVPPWVQKPQLCLQAFISIPQSAASTWIKLSTLAVEPSFLCPVGPLGGEALSGRAQKSWATGLRRREAIPH